MKIFFEKEVRKGNINQYDILYCEKEESTKRRDSLKWTELSKKWLIQKGQVLKEEFYWKEESWKERV